MSAGRSLLSRRRRAGSDPRITLAGTRPDWWDRYRQAMNDQIAEALEAAGTSDLAPERIIAADGAARLAAGDRPPAAAAERAMTRLIQTLLLAAIDSGARHTRVRSDVLVHEVHRQLVAHAEDPGPDRIAIALRALACGADDAPLTRVVLADRYQAGAELGRVLRLGLDPLR